MFAIWISPIEMLLLLLPPARTKMSHRQCDDVAGRCCLQTLWPPRLATVSAIGQDRYMWKLPLLLLLSLLSLLYVVALVKVAIVHPS